MTVVYIFAHFDDEYCALPLIDRAVAEGKDQLFLYVADYAGEARRARRHGETRALLRWLRVDPARAVHVGQDAGAMDGQVHRALPAAYAALHAALAGVTVERIVCPAWEGGHMDHDMCCLLAAEVARTRGAPVEMVGLYNGKGLPAPLFHGGRALAENGPRTVEPMSVGTMVRWMAAVRFFWRERAWLGLWPTMFWTYARHGFGYQRLDPGRLRERPHEGVLLYERMFKVPYAEVRAAADAFLDRA
ncbi:MAG: PIG-L family deacetylase [Proteobacteria bacterium]|nr:PIG-L family deacetylase [Pseudomonadota bacterium]